MARSVEFIEEDAIQAAMEVFWKKGFNGASLRDLTDAMQINSSSLYNTIGDKQELFVRCVTNYTDIRKKDMQQRLEGKGSAFKRLVNYINDAVETIVSGTNSCMAVKSAFEVATVDKRVLAVLKADSDYTYHFLYSLIAESVEDGAIRADQDPEMLANFFISTWTGWYESFILHRDAAKIKRMAAYFIQQIKG